jgi:hypothetical protein
MLSSKLVIRQCTIAAALLAAALLAPAAAEAKIKVSVLGWTTQGGSYSPQVANDKTIDTCLDMGNGQRSLYVIYKGKGIPKNVKVGVGVWGGPPNAGFATEPTDADVIKNAFKWPVGEKKSLTQRYGFSFAKGPFGPQQINGTWNAKIIIKKKVVARATITVAC